MVSFTYTAADLDRGFEEVLGGPGMSLGEFGVLGWEYEAAAAVDFDAIEENGDKVTEDLVQKHGFKDIADFMRAYTRGHVWNGYHYNMATKENKKETLRGWLMHYYSKAKKFHPADNVPFPPNDGNMVDYLMSFKPEWLITVGW